MKKLKNLTCVILVLCLSFQLGMFSFAVPSSTASLESETINYTDGYFDYSRQANENTWTVVGLSDSVTDSQISIPGSVNGKPVTEIGWMAFYRDTFTEITIPDSIKTIGSGAFKYCNYLEKINYSASSGITSIKNRAFAYCSRLKMSTLPNKTESIGEYAFYKCYSIENLYIPKSVKIIDEYAFACCYSIKNITVAKDNPYYSDINGVLYSKDLSQLLLFGASRTEKSFTVPNTVTSIVYPAFACSDLASISIPSTVKSISNYSFSGCYYLTSITIPDSVTKIGYCLFDGCSKLATINLGNKTKSIGGRAFANCGRLTKIKLPKSVTSIDWGAFANCYQLSDVYYSGSKDNWNNISINSDNDYLLNATIHFNSISEYDLKIMTYNVYCKNEKVKNAATGKVTDCRYETRARYIVNNIMDNEPDSIGLQEVTPELKLFLENFEDLNGRILGARYAAVGEYRDSGTDKSNEGCFIYYNKDKYQVVKSGTIWLSESAEKYSKHSESNYARIATYALLENKETGEEYVHVNTHLEHDHTSEKKTNSAAVSGAEQIVQLLNSSFPNTPAVITGDFNQLKDSAPYNVFINAGFYDSRDASQTKNTYHNSYGIGSGSTPYAAKTIDHILYNGYFNKKSYTVYDEDYSNEAKYGRLKLDYKYPSDHHPVVAAIGTKAKEAELLPVTMSLGISSSTKTVLNDRWFTQNNKEYNHELARFCANFVLGGYKSDSGKMKSWLSQAGFNTSEMNFETGRDEVNYFIASKDIKVGGTVKKVVFAGFIGSHDDQWFSNFDPLGNERANWKDRNAPYAPTTSDNTVHKGFADAREYVYARLKEYMNRNGINKDNSILLITGHSRGAATANLLAAYLIDENSLVSPDRLFTYTFATPNVAKIGKVGDKYNSIFNIVNPEDFVTKVLLSS